jgi:phenylacetate-coenzyme A ligase PaaK-like adenylate-forming protein
MERVIEEIFEIKNEQDFNEISLKTFNYQAANISIYRDFINSLGVKREKIQHYTEIPFLPIEFFKHHSIIKNLSDTEITFSSSGTTGTETSKHYVKDVSIYEKSYLNAFEYFYETIKNSCIIALLPNYLERSGSSLIYMVEDLIHKSDHPDSGFLLYDHDILHEKLQRLKTNKQKTILIGVTYALLDFVEKYTIDFPELIIMETGGMKGKRKEMIREELHKTLGNGFGVKNIHSEYGMTELLSQAYSKGNGVFDCPPWMKILIRDINDPLSLVENNKNGGINVIDLANIYSCSFIATQDLGRKQQNGSFEVLGRFDNSMIRGCNLLLG